MGWAFFHSFGENGGFWFFFFNSSNVNKIRRKAFSFLTVNTKGKNQTENKIYAVKLREVMHVYFRSAPSLSVYLINNMRIALYLMHLSKIKPLSFFLFFLFFFLHCL